MRKIEEQIEIDNNCKSLFVNKFNVTCWQPDPSDPLKKIKYIMKLQKIDSIKGELVFKSRHNKLLAFTLEDLFIFCDRLQLIFKTPIININESEVVVNKPSSMTFLMDVNIEQKESTEDQLAKAGSTGKVKFVESNIMKTIHVSEDEKYAEMRAAPRSKTNKDQKVVVKFLTKKFENKTFDLFDLSRGGAGIVFKNADHLSQGDFIELIKVDERDLNPPLKGEVMSVKTHDLESGLLKAGIKFVT